MADDADIADEIAERERTAALAGREIYTGESAEECEDCGDEIPIKRRQAIPGCTRCAFCQGLVERYR